MSTLDKDFRSPFATSVWVGCAAVAVSFVAVLALTFTDINDDALPEWLVQRVDRDIYGRVRNRQPADPQPGIVFVEHHAPRDYATRMQGFDGYFNEADRLQIPTLPDLNAPDSSDIPDLPDAPSNTEETNVPPPSPNYR